MHLYRKSLLFFCLLLTPVTGYGLDLSVHNSWVAGELGLTSGAIHVGTHLAGKLALEFSYSIIDGTTYVTSDEEIHSFGAILKYSFGPFNFGGGVSHSRIAGKVKCDYYLSGYTREYTYSGSRLNAVVMAGLRWPLFRWFLGFNIATVHFPQLVVSNNYDSRLNEEQRAHIDSAIHSDPIGLAMSFVAGMGF